MNLKCSKCLIIKDESLFAKDKKNWTRNYKSSWCKACYVLHVAQWRRENPEHYSEIHKKHADKYYYGRISPVAKKVRQAVISGYGGKCNCCGENEEIFLQIDHIHNDGNKYRKNGLHGANLRFYRFLIQNNFPKDIFQILCANCNWGKHRNGGICPHKTKGDSNGKTNA